MSDTDSPHRLLPADWTPPPPRGQTVLAEPGTRVRPAQLTLEEAAAYMNVSETWLEESAVPVVRLPTTGISNRKMRRWRRKDLDTYMEEHLCHDSRTL